jgi:hypothetical protein
MVAQGWAAFVRCAFLALAPPGCQHPCVCTPVIPDKAIDGKHGQLMQVGHHVMAASKCSLYQGFLAAGCVLLVSSQGQHAEHHPRSSMLSSTASACALSEPSKLKISLYYPYSVFWSIGLRPRLAFLLPSQFAHQTEKTQSLL